MSVSTLDRPRRRAGGAEPDLDIDPRIAERREAVEGEHRRKRRRTLLALSAITVVALGGVGLTRSAALDVDRIDVLGADRTAVDGLIASSGLSIGAPMTELDLDGARQAIADLPWIADVRVKRQWPNGVSIAVRERTPVAAVPTVDDRWALVDQTGHVLTVAGATSDRWPRLDGVAPADRPGTRLARDADDPLAVAAALPPDLLDGLDRIVVDERGEIELPFRTGPTARLGTIDSLDDKLAAVLAVFAQVDDCGIDVIDVRAVDPIAVTRVPSCRAVTTGTDATDASGAATDSDAAAGTDIFETDTGTPLIVDETTSPGDLDG